MEHQDAVHVKILIAPSIASPILVIPATNCTVLSGFLDCPVDFKEDEKLEDGNKVNMQLVTHSDNTDWEKKIPYDLDKCSTDFPGMSKKEVYFLLRKGIYIKNPQEWFSITTWSSISKNSKKRQMLPARSILKEELWRLIFPVKQSWLWKQLPGSRFDLVGECCDINHMKLSFTIETQLLSRNTRYACYLVYKLPENYSSAFEGIVVTGFKVKYSTNRLREHHMYLLANPHTPIIESSTDDERPSRTRKIKGHPKLRKDGWMEVQVWVFRTKATRDIREVDGYIKSLNGWNFTGLLVQGIEFRPLKVSFYPSSYDIRPLD